MDGYLPAWVITLITLAGSTAITTIVGLIIKYKFDKEIKKKEAREATVKAQEEELRDFREKQQREERKKDLTEIIKPLEEKIDNLHNNLDLNTTGTITLLRDRMKCSLNFCKKQGFVTATDIANWMEMYNAYKDLGGNHFREYVDAWKFDMCNLPTEDEFNKIAVPPEVKKTRRKVVSK